MELDDLRLLAEVAQRRSFAAVARARGIDPSSVSRAVASVEGTVGARLFERTTRALAPTEAGQAFLARVAPLIQELERASEEARSARSEPAGTLRLTASVAFGQVCLVPLLPAFRAAFPKLELDLMLTDANLDLVAERVDLAVRLAPSLRGDVVGAKLFATRYRVCASPAYCERAGPLRRPADLAERDCLLFALPEFRHRWLFRRAGKVVEVPVRGSLMISSPLAIRDAAIAGLGPALLADWMIAEEMRRGRLVDLFPGYDVTATTFDTAAWLLYPSRDYLPRKTRAAIDFLRARLGRPRMS